MENQESRIVLASTSPRRKQLLTEAGYNFICVEPDVDESAFSTDRIEPCEYAGRLALAKAESVAVKYPENLIIGADTIADFDGEIIGKALDDKDAEQITRKLFSKPHKVITAVAIVKRDAGVEMVEAATTIVYPRKLTDGQIAEHIKSGCWRGKAGAYAIQENGDEFIERIEGSLTNVMGLPMELLKKMLRDTDKRCK